MPQWSMFCPRCDRPYTEVDNDVTVAQQKVLEKVKTHVELQHPDHDPLWYDTYPEGLGTPDA